MKKFIFALILSFTVATNFAQTTVEEDLASLRTNHYGSLNHDVAQDDVITNDITLPELLTEFYDGAVFYRIEYRKELQNLKQVKFVVRDLNFLGSVEHGGQVILLNDELRKYPNLARVIFYNQMGKLYGLEAVPGREFMSDTWEINQDNEDIATRHREKPYQRKNFFKTLQKRRGAKKQI